MPTPSVLSSIHWPRRFQRLWLIRSAAHPAAIPRSATSGTRSAFASESRRRTRRGLPSRRQSSKRRASTGGRDPTRARSRGPKCHGPGTLPPHSQQPVYRTDAHFPVSAQPDAAGPDGKTHSAPTIANPTAASFCGAPGVSATTRSPSPRRDHGLSDAEQSAAQPGCRRAVERPGRAAGCEKSTRTWRSDQRGRDFERPTATVGHDESESTASSEFAGKFTVEAGWYGNESRVSCVLEKPDGSDRNALHHIGKPSAD